MTSVLEPEEIEASSVHWGLGGRAGDVWVRIDVPDERHEELLLSPWWVPDPWGVEVPTGEARIATHLGDRLEDWGCETTFARGQQRRARHELPDTWVGAPRTVDSTVSAGSALVHDHSAARNAPGRRSDQGAAARARTARRVRAGVVAPAGTIGR